MKIKQTFAISCILFCLAPTLWAKSVCEDEAVLQELKQHLQQSTFDEADDYLLRRLVTFAPFAYQYFKQDERELYRQLAGKNLKATDIMQMQIVRYENIYQHINQKFVAAFQLKSTVEDDAPYFSIMTDYEYVLKPILQKHLAQHQHDLMATLQGEASEDLNLQQKNQEDEQQLRQTITEKLPFRWSNIQEDQLEKHVEGQLSSCRLNMSWSDQNPVVLQYEVNVIEKPKEIFVVPLYLTINQQKMAYDAVGQYFLKALAQ